MATRRAAARTATNEDDGENRMAGRKILSDGDEESPAAKTQSMTMKAGGEGATERQIHKATYFPSRHVARGIRATRNRNPLAHAKRASRGAIRQQMAAGAGVEGQGRH